MRHLVYNVTYSVLPINSSLLTITLYCSVITTLVYNYSVLFLHYNRVRLFMNLHLIFNVFMCV